MKEEKLKTYKLSRKMTIQQMAFVFAKNRNEAIKKSRRIKDTEIYSHPLMNKTDWKAKVYKRKKNDQRETIHPR